MTDHCDPHCPFLGCASCEYAGGERASNTTKSVQGCETMEARKTAPAGALTPVRPGPRHESLGGLVTNPNATPLTGSAAANLDGCPNCVMNAELPYAGFTAPSGGLVCMYLCADCGHRWHTSWAVSA